MTSPPSGWYPVGDGTARYWDGSSWTQQVRPAGPDSSAPPQPVSVPAVPRQRDGFGIASLILSVPGVLLLSIPLGLIGWSRVRRGTRRGRAPAVIGLVLSVAWIVVVVVVLKSEVGNRVSRDATGAATSAGKLSPARLRIGDCVRLPADVHRVRLLDVVPCDRSHNGQVFKVLVPTDGPYPGVDALRQASLDACSKELVDWLGTSPVSLTVVTFVPTAKLWSGGDRTERCLAVDREQDVTGDMRHYR